MSIKSNSWVVSVNYQVVNFNSVVSFSEILKEEDCAKTRSLQVLKDENDKLTQELDSSRQGQSELLKVNRALTSS